MSNKKHLPFKSDILVWIFTELHFSSLILNWDSVFTSSSPFCCCCSFNYFPLESLMRSHQTQSMFFAQSICIYIYIINAKRRVDPKFATLAPGGTNDVMQIIQRQEIHDIRFTCSSRTYYISVMQCRNIQLPVRISDIHIRKRKGEYSVWSCGQM